MPRKPPTPTTTALIWPWRSNNEILDVTDPLSSRVLHVLAEKHSDEPFVQWLTIDERYVRGRPFWSLGKRWAGKRSGSQSQSPAKFMICRLDRDVLRLVIGA